MNFGTKKFSRIPMPLTLRLDVEHRALQILLLVPMANLSDYKKPEHVEAEEDIPLQSMNSNSRFTTKHVFTTAAVIYSVKKAEGVSSQLYNRTSSAD